MESSDENIEEEELRYFRSIMAFSAKFGVVVVERSVCPVCKGNNSHVHDWTEILTCWTVGCKARYPSKARRPPHAGEATAEDFRTALEALHDAQLSQIRNDKPKPRQEELDALPAGTRLLVERACLASAREAILKVMAVAEQLASIS